MQPSMDIEHDTLESPVAHNNNSVNQAGPSHLNTREYPQLSGYRQPRSQHTQTLPVLNPLRRKVYKEVRYKTTSEGLVVIDPENSIRINMDEDPTPVEVDSPVKRPPPMYLSELDRYTELRSLLLQNNLQPKYTKQQRTGICLQMNTVDDFGKLRRLMDIHKMERFIFKLEDEKPLKVVIRRASKLLSMQEIEEDLTNQKMPFSRITRLKKNRNEN